MSWAPSGGKGAEPERCRQQAGGRAAEFDEDGVALGQVKRPGERPLDDGQVAVGVPPGHQLGESGHQHIPAGQTARQPSELPSARPRSVT